MVLRHQHGPYPVLEVDMIVLSQINLHLGHTPRTSPGCSGPTWTRSPSSARTSRRPSSSSRRPGTRVPKRARTPPAVARKGLEKTRAGILVQDEAHGLDDGTEALQRALSVLRNSATGQSMIPFDRR